MGDDTLKTKKSAKSVYDKLNAELDVMDTSAFSPNAFQSAVSSVKRRIRSLYMTPSQLDAISDANKRRSQKVYSQKHYTLLKKVEAMEAKMIEKGNK